MKSPKAHSKQKNPSDLELTAFSEELPHGKRLSLRINPENPDHHLWNNNGTWWCHYTEHLPDYTKRRVRVSLGTSDLELARQRRDAILNELSQLPLAA